MERLIDKMDKGFGDVQKSMHSKIGNINASIAELREAIEGKMTALEGHVENLEKAQPVTDSKLEGRVAAIEGSDPLSAIHAEFQLMQSKNKNLVVFGIHESEAPDAGADRTATTKLLNEIDSSADFHCYRSGPATANQRPLIVKFQSVAQRDMALSNAKSLKGKDEYRMISLSPDLTKKQ
jgi:hypothetical protein